MEAPCKRFFPPDNARSSKNALPGSLYLSVKFRPSRFFIPEGLNENVVVSEKPPEKGAFFDPSPVHSDDKSYFISQLVRHRSTDQPAGQLYKVSRREEVRPLGSGYGSCQYLFFHLLTSLLVSVSVTSYRNYYTGHSLTSQAENDTIRVVSVSGYRFGRLERTVQFCAVLFR